MGMMEEAVLDSLVENVSKAKRENSIFTLIEGIHHEYHKDNYNVLQRIYDAFDEVDSYNVIEDANQFYDHTCDADVERPHLKDYKNAPNPSLRFGKVYVQYMITDQEHEEAYKSHKVKNEFTFKKCFSKHQLSILYDFLIANDIIKMESKKDFIKIFSAVNKKEVYSPIKWNLTYRKKFNSNVPFITLFWCIHNYDFYFYRNTRSRAIFIDNVIKHFHSAGQNPNFQRKRVERALERWNEDYGDYAEKGIAELKEHLFEEYSLKILAQFESFN